MNKVSVCSIRQRKGKKKVTMLTCYDYSFAKILDSSGIDILLVGDSMSNVVLGLKETRKVAISEMVNHTLAVGRAVKNALVVADMPYLSYQTNPEKSLYYAKKFISSGAEAVKIEWFGGDKFLDNAAGGCPYVVKKLIKNKVPVMGHIGLTPQTVHLLGGYRVQGKDKKEAAKLIQQAKLLQDLGVFSIVLECIPCELAEYITKNLTIPTIGIGAGKFCDGQVLVVYDCLGLYPDVTPKFVKRYCDLSKIIDSAAKGFISDVQKMKFPDTSHSYHFNDNQWDEFKADL